MQLSNSKKKNVNASKNHYKPNTTNRAHTNSIATSYKENKKKQIPKIKYITNITRSTVFTAIQLPNPTTK